MRSQLPIIKLEVKLSELPQAVADFKKSRKEALETLTDEIKSAVSEGFLFFSTIRQLLSSDYTIFKLSVFREEAHSSRKKMKHKTQ